MENISEAVLDFQLEEDLNVRNDFIDQYRPFIINTVSKCTGRYVQTVDSDEYAIGLEAFNEAISKYESKKGNFISFAALVIRSRVLDYLRKESRYYGSVEANEEVMLQASTRVNEDLVAEITSFKEMLMKFGITMEKLAEESPKHYKTKKEIVDLGINVAKNDPISTKLYETKKLPMAAIMRVWQTTKKRLKTYRNYIIGVVIIYKEELDIMKTYLAVGGETDE